MCGHYHISPSMDIDASVCYLPENTWLVDGMLHGQGSWDGNVTTLILSLLLTDDIDDVHSDPAYPQFISSQNPADGVYGRFKLSKSGYLTRYDTVFTVTNLSREHSISIKTINGLSLGLFFDVDQSVILAPMESVDIPVSGWSPKKTVSGRVKIVFAQCGNKVTVGGGRMQSFTAAGTDIENAVLLDNSPQNLPERSLFGKGYVLRLTGLSFLSDVFYYILSTLSFVSGVFSTGNIFTS